MASVKLRGIGKAFGSTAVLRDVDLAVEDGEFVVLVGPSGCGKSTLLRVVAGLEEVDDGDILIDGTRVNDLAPAKRGIAMVFQSYALYPHMTVRQNMAFGLRLAGKDKATIAAAVDKAAALLDITHLLDRRPKMLSGGQRQRVAIGRAIVREPTVFLFDEPLSNLDAELRVRMRYEFAKLHQRLKTTTLYVTHDQVEAMTLADRIAIIDQGRVVQFGPAEELYQHPCSMFVAGFIGSPRMNFFEGVVQTANPSGAALRLRGGQELGAAVNAAGAAPGAPATLGVRPEHLRLAGQGIAASVTLIESLGSIRFAYLASDVSDDPVILQLSPNDRLKEGEPIFLAAEPADCHLFDGEGRAFARLAAGPGSIAA
ncbi:MAG TPA: ABC transporter ATP-binding protein [Allosphingosinicella sp.]|jgi:multiple sugar transport system ATP-binding protein